MWSQAIEHQRMNRPNRPCEESEDYNLADCINRGMAQRVGCQAFWSNFSGIPICPDMGSLMEYIRAYEDLMYYNTFDKHGCPDPCTYIEYQVSISIQTFYFLLYISPQVIEEPTKYYTDGKKNTNITRLKIMFGSTTLHIEREQEAFPFPSLVADCGGTLGLFIGFNFLMIWDFFRFLVKLGWNKMKQ